MARGTKSGARSDTIRLALPAGGDLVGVAMLVLGGLAVRLDLTFENLEDLELAVESLLGRIRDGEDANLIVDVGDRSLTASVGPLDEAAIRSELEDASDAVGLRRVLHTVADGYELVEREGSAWLSIEKGVGRGVSSGEQE